MQFNHQIKCCNYCGSEIDSTSGDVPISSRRMTMKEMVEMMIKIYSRVSGLSQEQGSTSSSEGNFELINNLGTVIEVMMIRKIQQLLTEPRVKDLIGTVVRGHLSESIQPVLDKLLAIEQRSSEAETMAPTSVRTLQFVFLDEVSGPVLTSKEIKSEEDKPIRVKLIDEKTGDTVKLGSESSLRAEIVLLDASDDSNVKNWTFEDFLSRIIKEGDKTMPHFSKTQYIVLDEGEAVLRDIKLGHDKSWTKKSKCKLGVRLAGNIKGGVEVREAWTNSFEVRDSRPKRCEKGNPPCLSDPLWKLNNIGRDGDPLKRLEENNIRTVRDFRFLHSIDPMGLQKIYLGDKRKVKDSASNSKWDAIVKHAMTCRIDDTDIYVHFPHTESQTGVVVDAVGGLKGLIDNSHYIGVDDLSEQYKSVARELLLSAFEKRDDTTSFHDETSLLERFPHQSNDVDVAAEEYCVGELTAAQVSECDPSTSRLGGGDFSNEEDGTAPQFLHDFEQYDDVPCFSSSPGTMQLCEQNLMHPTMNQSPNYYQNLLFDCQLWNHSDADQTYLLHADGGNQRTGSSSSLDQQLRDKLRVSMVAYLSIIRFLEGGSRVRAQKRQRIR